MSSRIEDFIGVFPQAVPLETCDALIEDFEENYKLNLHFRRGSYSNLSKLDVDDDSILYTEPAIDTPWVLNNKKQSLVLGQSVGECLYEYQSTFGNFKGVENTFFSTIKVQRTSPGQGYHSWHCEQCSRGTSHRFLFYIVYLNDVKDGGETEFLYYSRRIEPQAGTVLIAPASFTHTHRGNPPLKQDKYIATGWLEW